MVRPAYRSDVATNDVERRPVWRRRLLAGVAGIAVLLTGVLVAAWVTAPAPARPKEVVLARLVSVARSVDPV